MMKEIKKYKKYIIAAACMVAVLWIGCISFAIVYKNAQNRKAQEYQTNFAIVTQQYIAQSTAARTTSNSLTESGTLSPNETTSEYFTFDADDNISPEQPAQNTSTPAEIPAQETQLTLPQGKEAIVTAYVTAVNKLKGTDNFTLIKENEPSVEVIDVTGGSLIKDTVNSSIKENTEKIISPATYNFSGGKTADGTLPTAVIAPENKNAVLASGDVVSAKAEKVDDNSYKITITLGTQTQTLEKSAPGYSGVMDVISLDDFDLPSSLQITSLNITYTDSSIEAVIDKDGKLISMTHDMNIEEVVGEGKLTIISSTLKMKGQYHSAYKITY